LDVVFHSLVPDVFFREEVVLVAGVPLGHSWHCQFFSFMLDSPVQFSQVLPHLQVCGLPACSRFLWKPVVSKNADDIQKCLASVLEELVCASPTQLK